MKVNSPSKVPPSSSFSCRPYRKTGVEKTEQWDALLEEDRKAPQGFVKQRWSRTIHCATSLSLCLSNYHLAPRAGNLLCCATLDKKGMLWKWSNSEELVSPPRQGRTARSSPLRICNHPPRQTLRKTTTTTTQRNQLRRQQSP